MALNIKNFIFTLYLFYLNTDNKNKNILIIDEIYHIREYNQSRQQKGYNALMQLKNRVLFCRLL